MREEHREANRRNWDERVAVHRRSRFYDVEGFAADPARVELAPGEAAEMGEVRGASLVHLQCHMGLETLSWARLGASRVVGLDFAPSAIAVAREVAARAGLADRARFVHADVHDAPAALAAHAPFDRAYVSVGAVCWLPEIDQWARVVAALLAPGGVLYVREVHPALFATVERDGGVLELIGPYFERPDAPVRCDDGTTYTDGADAPLTHATTYEWNHGLGEIVTALLDAGLSLELLREHREAEWPALPSMTRDPSDRMYRLPADKRDALPLTFSLRARKR